MHLYLKHIRIKLMLFIIYDETSRAHAKTIRHASPVVTYVNAGLFQNMESLCVVSVLKKIHMLKTISVYLIGKYPVTEPRYSVHRGSSGSFVRERFAVGVVAVVEFSELENSIASNPNDFQFRVIRSLNLSRHLTNFTRANRVMACFSLS